MTEIEDTLSRALAAEADRHEPPVFNAYRIAEAATAGRRFWRRPLFALIAAAIGTAGAGGAAVLAAAGGQHRLADQVTVTIQSPTGSAGLQIAQSTDGVVKAWVRKRAAAEGLKDVTATVLHGPWRLEVRGHAGDLDRLKTFGEPGILQFRPVTSDLMPALGQGDRSQPCQVSVGKTGAPWPACDRDGVLGGWVADPVGGTYHVAATRAEPFFAGAKSPTWGIVVTLGTAGAPSFEHGTTAVMIDGAVAGAGLPQADGEVGFVAGSTARQADLLAAILATQGPADLEGATVTVSAG